MIYEKIKLLKIPKQTLTNIIVCLAGLLVIVLAGIVPNIIFSANLDRKISNVKALLEEQDKLHPVYQLLEKNTQQKVSKVLPFPVKDRLSRKLIDLFPATFRDMAKKAGMDVVSISPDLNSLSDNSTFLIFNTVIRGDFFNFRKLLVNVGEVPYSERVEEIEIQQNQDTMEFKMKIRLALA
ncbi:MAG: hypothetical protein Q8M56_01390 [Desulfobacterales bacterium]|jgi:hypothetical protein|nr:hypothetical protein [Desulfobacterales bacterium]